MDRKFVISALLYGILGLALGIHMAASHNHGQMVTHAHIMLIGFLLSFIYGLCHRLWLDGDHGRLARVQFWLHQAGAISLLPALFLVYGQFVSPETLEPVLSLASLTVFAGLILMAVLFVLSNRSEPQSSR